MCVFVCHTKFTFVIFNRNSNVVFTHRIENEEEFKKSMGNRRRRPFDSLNCFCAPEK